jgi:nitrate reductase NapE component
MNKLKKILYLMFTILGIIALMLLASFGFAYWMCKATGIV